MGCWPSPLYLSGSAVGSLFRGPPEENRFAYRGLSSRSFIPSNVQKKMDSDDEMDCESENGDEFLEYETATLASLRTKELIVQNSDGTLRCPLSPSRKKQAYAYKDLLQHAKAVACGKRGPEAAGQHSALQKFMESDLSSLATPAPERLLKVEHQLPRRRQAADMLVCPWSVVIYNIDNSERDPTKPEMQIGYGKTELQKYFKEFNPAKIEVLWSHRGEGHLGVCVVHFGRELSDLRDAQALENSFLDKEHGLRDYERRLASGDLGLEFYGWLAREEDFKGRSVRRGEEIGRHLRKIGDLKDFAMVGEEMSRIKDQQVRQLAESVSEKNREFSNLKTEMVIIRRNAETERLQLEEAHKKELDEVRNTARASEEKYNRAALESNRALERREAELRQLDRELREKESNLNSTAERSQLQSQMMENQHRQEMLANQQGVLQQKEVDKIKLVQKHEEETRTLANLAQKAKLQLANKQKKEMEKQQLETILETEKLFDKLTISSDTGNGSKKADELEKKSKKVEELEEKLEELESSHEDDQGLISILTVKDRQSTDEIVHAQQMAVQVMKEIDRGPAKRLIEAALEKKDELDKTRNPQPRVGVKMAGEIDESPWSKAYQKRFKNDNDWDLKMKQSLSMWEDLIRDPAFHPFRTVEIGKDKYETQIDHTNERLSDLKKDLGVEVYNSVTTALMELDTYNASGRYPVPVAWVFKESRKATLKEVVGHLGQVIKAVVATNAPRKKARG